MTVSGDLIFLTLFTRNRFHTRTEGAACLYWRRFYFWRSVKIGFHGTEYLFQCQKAINQFYQIEQLSNKRLNAPLYCMETSKEQVSKWHSLRESVLSHHEGSAMKDV
jgi:hypothetical protein